MRVRGRLHDRELGLDKVAAAEQSIGGYRIGQPMLVAVPEPASIADAYAMVKVCWTQRRDLELGLVVNRARSQQEAHDLHEKFEQIVGRFLGASVGKVGHVLEDRKVEEAIRSQEPLVLAHPDSAAAQCIVQVAEGLLSENESLKIQGSGLFERLMNPQAAEAGP